MDNQQGFFSRKLRAGKRRTYFFDVRSTKQGDYFVTITESKRRFDKPGYDSHKIFLYKEDFKKFGEALNETMDHIKTELNPDFDYDSYDREAYYENHDAEGDKRESKNEKKDVEKPKYGRKNIDTLADARPLREDAAVETTADEPSFELEDTNSDTGNLSDGSDKEAMEW